MKVLCEMPGGKKNTVYRKKRKGKPFTGAQRYGKIAKETPHVDGEIGDPTQSSLCDQTPTDAECDQAICTSRQKMRREDASDNSSESADDEKNFQGEGYRLVDLKKLSAALSEAHVCKEGCLTVEENSSGRNGLLADPSLECSFCLEATPLETSARITKRGQSFDINRSAVYHFLETGGGYEGFVSFCSIMKMPCLSLPAYYKQVHTILEPLKPKKK